MANTFYQVVIAQGHVLNTMATFKKPADTQFLFAPTVAALEAGEAIKKDRKSPINHVKIIMESYSLFNWSAFENEN